MGLVIYPVFYDCPALATLNIGDNVQNIPDYAFRSCCGLTSVDFGNSVTSIGDYAFSGCSGLTSVTIGNSVTSIGEGAFQECSGLTSVTIGNSVTSIGEGAFQECSGLTSVTIPNSVTSIGSSAFSSCSGLTSVTIPSSVMSIGSWSFSGCSGLTSVTIGNSVTSIGYSAFNGCSGLTSVTIPNSVTSIGSSAFSSCSGLTSVTIENRTPLMLNSNTFTNGGNATLYVPYGSKKAYQEAAVWKDFKEIIEIGADEIEEKLARLQAVADDCEYFVEEVLSDEVNSLMGREDLESRKYCLKEALSGIESLVYSFHEVAASYINSINSGSVITRDEIEQLVSDWESGKGLIHDVFSLMRANNVEFKVTSSSGGCVNVEDLSVTNESKPVRTFNSKAFSTDWSSVDKYHQVYWPTSGLGSFELSAIPDEGFHVKSFLRNGIEQTSNTITISDINSDEEIVVEFEPDYYPNKLAIEDASVVQGGWVTVPISMTNENDITAFQFELELPEGFSVQNASLTSRKSNQTMSYTQMTNGNYQFAAFSLNAKAFSGNEGTLVNLMLKASSTVSPGDYTVKVKNIELTTTDEQACKPSSRWATLTVKNIRVGDANGDGNISITDAVAVVNKVLGKPSTAFREEAADVNGDGRITITDAVAIVNIVLGKRPANARVREPQ